MDCYAQRKYNWALVNDTAREIAQLVARRGLRIYEIREVLEMAYRMLENVEASFVPMDKKRKGLAS